MSRSGTFIPDSVFKGSSLTGWRILGQATWQAQNGELVGAAKGGGGWLVLDRSYQDVALHVLQVLRKLQYRRASARGGGPGCGAGWRAWRGPGRRSRFGGDIASHGA